MDKEFEMPVEFANTLTVSRPVMDVARKSPDKYPENGHIELHRLSQAGQCDNVLMLCIGAKAEHPTAQSPYRSLQIRCLRGDVILRRQRVGVEKDFEEFILSPETNPNTVVIDPDMAYSFIMYPGAVVQEVSETPFDFAREKSESDLCFSLFN